MARWECTLRYCRWGEDARRSPGQTGVTLFKLSEGVDTGDIVAQQVIPIDRTTDAGTLYSAVDQAHISLMKTAFPELAAGRLLARPQDDRLATYWPKRTAGDGAIDLEGSVHEAERLVRAVTRPYPGAFFLDGQGRKVIVWKAEIDQDGDADRPGLRVPFSDGVLRVLDRE